MPLCSSPYSAGQMAGRMELTASGRPAMMRYSVRKRQARVLTTHSWAGSLPKPQDLGLDVSLPFRHACLVPCVVVFASEGGRAHKIVMLDRIYRLPWRRRFPRSGSCCVSNTPRGFLYLSAGGHVPYRGFFLQNKKNK